MDTNYETGYFYHGQKLMRGKFIRRTALLVTMVGICACSRTEGPTTQGLPQNTIRTLSQADRATVKGISETYNNHTMLLSAQETKKVVEAISTASPQNPPRRAAVDLEVGFFQHTNLLGQLNVTGDGFGINGAVYVDTTGTLEALGAKFRDQSLTNRVR